MAKKKKQDDYTDSFSSYSGEKETKELREKHRKSTEESYNDTHLGTGGTPLVTSYGSGSVYGDTSMRGYSSSGTLEQQHRYNTSYLHNARMAQAKASEEARKKAVERYVTQNLFGTTALPNVTGSSTPMQVQHSTALSLNPYSATSKGATNYLKDKSGNMSTDIQSANRYMGMTTEERTKALDNFSDYLKANKENKGDKIPVRDSEGNIIYYRDDTKITYKNADGETVTADNPYRVADSYADSQQAYKAYGALNRSDIAYQTAVKNATDPNNEQTFKSKLENTSYDDLQAWQDNPYLTSEQKKWADEVASEKATREQSTAKLAELQGQLDEVENSIASLQNRATESGTAQQELADLQKQRSKLKDRIYQYSTGNWFTAREAEQEEYKNSPTFETSSQYDDSIDDLTYKIINGTSVYDKGEEDILMALSNGVDSNVVQLYWDRDYMTDDEKRMYNYIRKEVGEDEANAYLKDYVSYKSNERAQKQVYNQASDSVWESVKDDYSDNAIGHFLAGSNATLRSVASNVLSGVGFIDASLQKAINPNRPVDYNTDAFTAYNYTQGIRNTVNENIENPIGQFAYGTATSMLDSLVVMAGGIVGVPGATAILGGAAATDAMMQAKERGATDSQAIWVGLASGVAEGLFEEVSLEKLLTAGTPANIKQALWNICKQSFTEGSEEVFTSIANTLTDAWIMADKSEIQQNVQNYIKAGYSQTDAEKIALIEWSKGIVLDFAGGAVSGGIFGAGGQIVRGTQFNKGLNSVNKADDAWKLMQSYAQTYSQLLDENGEVSKDNTKAYDKLSATYDAKAKELGLVDETDSAKESVAEETVSAPTYSSAIEEKVMEVYPSKKAVENLLKNEEELKSFAELTGTTIPEKREGSAKQRVAVTDAWLKYRDAHQADYADLRTESAESTKYESNAENAVESSPVTSQDTKTALEAKYDASTMASPVAEFVNGYDGESNIDYYARAYVNAENMGRTIGDTSAFNEYWNKNGNSFISRETASKAFAIGVGSRTETVTVKQQSRTGTGTFKIEDNVSVSKDAQTALTNLAKRTGVDIVVNNRSSNNGANGYYNASIATMYLSADSNLVATAMHELGHRVDSNAVKEFQSIKSDFLGWYAKTQGYSSLRTMMQAYAKTYEADNLDRSGIETEMVNDAMASLFNREDGAEDLARWVAEDSGMTAEQQKSFKEKVKAFFEEILNAIKSLVNLDKTTPMQKRTLQMEAKQVREFRRRFLNALDTARENDGTYTTTRINTNDSTFTEADAVSPAEETRQSRELEETLYDAFYDMALKEGVYFGANNKAELEQMLEKAKEDRQLVKQFMNEHEKELRLPADKKGKTVFKNQSYSISVENTTVCVRSLMQDNIASYVEKVLGRKLTIAEGLTISQRIGEITGEPQCIYCYVAADRMQFDQKLGEFLNDRTVVFDSHKAGMSKEDAYNAMLAGRTATKKTAERFNLWWGEAKKGNYSGGLQNSDLAGINIDNSLIKKEKSKFTGLALQEYELAVGYAKSASHAKLRVGYVAYKGDILNKKTIPNKLVNELNSEYGLRFYSYSDYSPAFILENMQMMSDAAARGFKGLAYTKEIDFIKIFAPTGVNINTSLFCTGTGTNIAKDEMMGAKWNEARKLRDQYKNVGITMVVTNDDQVRWAMEQDWVDVVLPLHSVFSGGSTVAKLADFQDYKGVQEDKWSKQTDKLIAQLVKEGYIPEKQKATVYPSVHDNDLIKYINALIEKSDSVFDIANSAKNKSADLEKLISKYDAMHPAVPRFYDFLTGLDSYVEAYRQFNGKDSSAMAKAEEEFRKQNPNYMKLVNETRQSSSQTEFMKPVFNVEAAIESLNGLIKEGGYDAYAMRSEVAQNKVADAIADSIARHPNEYVVTDSKFTDDLTDIAEEAMERRNSRDVEYMDAVESGNEAKQRELVEQAAHDAGYTIRAYHGTPRADRVGNVFRKDRATSGPMAFFTDDRTIAQNYARDKRDTSFANDSRLDNDWGYYRVTDAKGNDLDIVEAFNKLPYATRNRLASKFGEITLDDEAENVVSVKGNKNGVGDYQFSLRENRSSPMLALFKSWFGNIDDEQFLDVLKLSGVTDALVEAGMTEPSFIDVTKRDEKVYDVFLGINNPFETGTMVSKEFVDSFRQWYEANNGEQYEASVGNNNADLYHKGNTNGIKFAEQVMRDIGDGYNLAWTRIPDSVTQYLKELGHDGIKDNGGKSGGYGHTVWIPFEQNQVKSADPVTYDDSGNIIPLSERFQAPNDDIRFSRDVGEYSYRGANEGVMPSFGYAMFTDNEDNAISYSNGGSVFRVKKSSLSNIEDVMEDIANAWDGESKYNYNLDYMYDVEGSSVADMFNPNDIIISAEAWDNNELIQWASENVRGFTDVVGYKTKDGGILFDENQAEEYSPYDRTNYSKTKNTPLTQSERQTLEKKAADAQRLADQQRKRAEYYKAQMRLTPKYTPSAVDIGILAKELSSYTGTSATSTGTEKALASIYKYWNKFNDTGEQMYYNMASAEIKNLVDYMLGNKSSDAEKARAELENMNQFFSMYKIHDSFVKGETFDRLEGFHFADKNHGGHHLNSEYTWNFICDNIPSLDRSQIGNRMNALIEAREKLEERAKATDSNVQVDESVANHAYSMVFDRIQQTRAAQSTKADVWKSKVDNASKSAQMAQGKKTAKELGRVVSKKEAELARKNEIIAGLRDELEDAKVKNEADSKAISAKDREILRLEKQAEKSKQSFENALNRANDATARANLRTLAEKQKGKQRLANARESRKVAELRPKLEKNVTALRNMITNPKEKEFKYVPDAMKEDVLSFLQLVQRHSVSYVTGNGMRQIDYAEKEALGRLKNIADKFEAGTSINELTIDFSPEFKQDIKSLIDAVKPINLATGGHVLEIKMADSDTLQLYNRMVKSIIHSVKMVNTLYVKGTLKNVAEACARTMNQDLKGLTFKGKDGVLDKHLVWSMATPYMAFERFGQAGHQLFMGIAEGWGNYAKDIVTIKQFFGVDEKDDANRLFTDKEQDDWTHNAVTVKATDKEGNDVDLTLTGSQLMQLYALAGREAAQVHLTEGGITINQTEANVNGKKQTLLPQQVRFTQQQLADAFAMLSDKQKDVVLQMVNFLSTTASDWGNYVSEARWGTRNFTEKNYFPMKVASNTLKSNGIDEAKNDNFWSIVNQSFTKALNENADQPLELSDIFSVFVNHATNMAKYHSLALPVLDMVRWYNYTNKTEADDGSANYSSVRDSIEHAYGKNATNYIRQFLVDLNGQQDGGRDGDITSMLTGMYKAAAVGANMRVALLQGTAIVRAADVINPTYLAKGMMMTGGTKEMLENSGIAIWKDLGFFDVDVAKSAQGQLLGSGSKVADVRDNIVELSMVGAELGDRLTWGAIWNACKAEVMDKQGLTGQALLDATTKRFDDLIMRTQVFDSTISRSQLMRSKNAVVKIATSFMAEPTMTYNMLMQKVFKLERDKQLYGAGQAWKMNSSAIGRTTATYLASVFVAAFAESLIDAMRDKDKDKYLDKLLEAMFGEWDDDVTFIDNIASFYGSNIGGDISIISKVPVIKDLTSFIQGYSNGGMYNNSIYNLMDSVLTLNDYYAYKTGKKDATKRIGYGKMNEWGLIYNGLKAASQLTGVPAYNLTRDVVSMYNTFYGNTHAMSIDTYTDTTKEDVKQMMESGLITEGTLADNYRKIYNSDMSTDQVKKYYENKSSLDEAGLSFDDVNEIYSRMSEYKGDFKLDGINEADITDEQKDAFYIAYKSVKDTDKYYKDSKSMTPWGWKSTVMTYDEYAQFKQWCTDTDGYSRSNSTELYNALKAYDGFTAEQKKEAFLFSYKQDTLNKLGKF